LVFLGLLAHRPFDATLTVSFMLLFKSWLGIGMLSTLSFPSFYI
jgi:hypothetical protein